jgi:ribosomal protein S18 acetylase RimI-like enzyme
MIMLNGISVINVDSTNISLYPPVCFMNPKDPGFQAKLEWLTERFTEGLKIKLLYDDNKCIGFIEYTPGEQAWRAVDATGYLFIHCIWVSPNKFKGMGNGSRLLTECLDDAAKEGKYGVAAVTSEGSFMAGKALFLKNGFRSMDSAKPKLEMMVKNLSPGPVPKFRDTAAELSRYQGLNLIYSRQCPWVARGVNELAATASERGLTLKITDIESAAQAQQAPSIYAVFNLVYNGKLLVDHYISKTRFLNIINKEKISLDR